MSLLIPNHHPINRDGLVLWLDYKNTGSVAATGTWEDYSGLGNDGTLEGTGGVDNGGLHCDGATGCRVGTAINPTMAFTVSMSFSTAEIASTNAQLFAKYDGTSGANDSYFIRKNGNTIQFYLRSADGSSWKSANAPSAVSINTRYQLDCVFDGSQMVVYLNGNPGTPTAKTDAIRANPTEQTYIASTNLMALHFSGRIGNVMVFYRALSAGEIQANYQRTLRA